ncbi:hypothetical protein [Streptomyces sp. CA-111067]|uniref:hypothetical protein n=1 Tax=Streptomyces sp. CA-111067 TaxID=3240046 RepID=UPI003D96E051
MTGRIPAARIPAQRKPPRRESAARKADVGRARPSPPHRDRAFLAAMWQILVSMGGPFVPLIPPPAEFEDDPRDGAWGDPDSEWGYLSYQNEPGYRSHPDRPNSGGSEPR